MTKVFYFNQFRECTYVLWDSTYECVIIDPGCQTDREKERLADFIISAGLTPVKILLTHGHFDHILGLEWAMQKWGIPAYMHPDDVEQLEINDRLCAAFGIDFSSQGVTTCALPEGTFRAMGGTFLEITHTPGHTRGSVCMYCESEEILFSGDTIFQGSIGRCDLPGGNEDVLLASVGRYLPSLPRATQLLPGHGYATTVGEELDTNPYMVYLD